jgi:hypothetical protein
MTDLLNRPLNRPATAKSPGGPVPRPLTVSAAISGGGAAVASLLVCMAVALTGWFLADAGAHGQTTDALRVGADAWLLGHGSRITVAGVPVGIVPLGLSVLFGFTSYRFGRWAGATSQPIEEDRSLAIGATIHGGLYLVVTVVTAVLATTAGASASVGRAIVGAVLLGGVAGALGLASGTGRLGLWLSGVPTSVLAVLRGALAVTFALVASATVLVVVALVGNLSEAATVMSSLHLGTGDGLMYALVTLAVAPNAVLLGSAYLLGPGFAVGTGTIVSPTAVALGPVPAFPLLAALPDHGPTPGAFVALMAVPTLVAALAVARVQRSLPTTAWDAGALRGFAAGIGAAFVTTLLVAVAGGPMGTGRMADIGAPTGEVLLLSLAALGGGGLLGGLVATGWQRRSRQGRSR